MLFDSDVTCMYYRHGALLYSDAKNLVYRARAEAIDSAVEFSGYCYIPGNRIELQTKFWSSPPS